jgi:hypothetical protein
MSKKIPLDMISVASPCTQKWDSMKGDDRTRFCEQCSLNVYNLSDLTQDQAESLVAEHEGKMCVRYFRRFDGTILTKDCPVGWAAIKRKAALIGGAAAAILVACFGFFTIGAFALVVGNGGRIPNPIRAVHDIFFPSEIAGGICVPPNQVPVNVQPPKQ